MTQRNKYDTKGFGVLAFPELISHIHLLFYSTMVPEFLVWEAVIVVSDVTNFVKIFARLGVQFNLKSDLLFLEWAAFAIDCRKP